MHSNSESRHSTHEPVGPGWLNILLRLQLAVGLDAEIVATTARGLLQVLVSGASADPKIAVDAACREAFETCDVCGGPGAFEASNGRYQVRCSAHTTRQARARKS